MKNVVGEDLDYLAFKTKLDLWGQAGTLLCLLFQDPRNIQIPSLYTVPMYVAAFTIRMPSEATMMLYFYIPIVILSIMLLPRPLFVFTFSKTGN